MLPAAAATGQALLDRNLLNDKDPIVVLNTLLKFTEIPLTPAIENAILARLETAPEADDRWLPDAFGVVLNAHHGALMQKYITKRKTATTPTTNHEHHHTPTTAPIAQIASTNYRAGGPVITQHRTGGPVNHSISDLAITNISLEPAQPSVREYARIALEIKNLGTVDVPKEKIPLVTLQIEGVGLKINYVSRKLDKGIGAGETIRLTEGNNGPWNAGFGFTAERAGKVSIKATVDVENVVQEAEETKNNTLTQEFEVKRPAKLSDFALERAARSLASTAPADSLLHFLRRANDMDNDGRLAAFKGLLNGWDGKRKEQTNEANKTLLVSLKNTIPVDLKSKFTRLTESFGITEATPTDPNVQLITIKSVKEAMKFDLSTFTVLAGKPVELVFENPDAMQHNLVIVKPKSRETVGNAADKMITQKDAADKNYVPNLPQHIVTATPLVNADQTYRLSFTAPTEAGAYPYLCTFPGHWRLMQGVMVVVKEKTEAVAK